MSKTLFSYLFKTNFSSFHAAILANNTNRIRRILSVKHDYIHRELDDAGNTALLVAIKYASLSMVRLLLEQGASPDQSNFLTFQTPLGLLAATVYEDDQSREAKKALELANLLLDHGAYIEKPSIYQSVDDDDGTHYMISETPLMTAVRTRNLPMAILFIERKANVNYVEKIFQNRPINFAIINGDVEIFDLLENAGASCRSAVNNEKNNLLHCFCQNKENDKHIFLLQKLIDNGCDINAENCARRTPLMLATSLDMVNTCRVLLDAYADTDKVDYKGFRAIDFAKPDSECLQLLKQGKNIQQSRSQSYHNKDRNHHRKKQYISTYPLLRQMSEPIRHSSTTENKIKPFISNLNYDEKEMESRKNLKSTKSNQEYNVDETHTKYKNMWENLLKTKQSIERARDLSKKESDKSCHLEKNYLLMSKTGDINQQECVITTEL